MNGPAANCRAVHSHLRNSTFSFTLARARDGVAGCVYCKFSVYGERLLVRTISGDWPVQARNARKNELGSSYPSKNDISALV